MLVSPDAFWVLLGALILDALIGDPDWLWRRLPHPVTWLGRLVALGDGRLNRETWSAQRRRAAGIVCLLVLLVVTLGAGWLIEHGLRSLPAGPAWVALAASILIAQRSLYEHVARVRDAFPEGTEAARRAVAMIVGRETARLDQPGIARAAIESTAENLSDGIVAPAFWFAIGGLPGLLAYKAVNTADSMIGHLSERYRDFGWAAARFDDLVNLVPARLSALLIAVAAPIAAGRIGQALRVAMRDAGTHRSPNAGWPEAAMAAALGIALGGPRIYAAGAVEAPYLFAEGRRDAGRADIGRGLLVMAGACIVQAVFVAGLALALSALPILDREAIHAREFPRVAGDQRQAARQRLAGDEDVIEADRRACRFQSSSYLARRTRIRGLEIEDCETEILNQLEMPLTPTVECPEIEFVQHDRRQRDVGRLCSSEAAQRRYPSFGDCGNGVCVEQISHLNRSSSSGRSCSATGSSIAA